MRWVALILGSSNGKVTCCGCGKTGGFGTICRFSGGALRERTALGTRRDVDRGGDGM